MLKKSDTPSDNGKKPEIKAKKPTDSKPEIKSKKPTDPKPEINIQKPTESKPEIKTKKPTESKPEIKTKKPTEPKPEIKTKKPTESKPEIKTETPTEPKPEIKTEKPTEPKPVKKVKPKKKKMTFKERLIYFKQMLLGKTTKQKRLDKPTYVGKKFLGILFLFIIVSAVLFYQSATSSETSQASAIVRMLILNNPYQFGASLTLSFIMLSFIFSNEKLLSFIFEKYSFPKQLVLIVGLFCLNFFVIIPFLNQQAFDLYSFLLIFAMLWLILQSLRIYLSSREVATKLESRLVSRYSPFRYVFASITPYIILGFLVFISWMYRFYTVSFSLDLLGAVVPGDALEVYIMQMRIVMPMLYIGLLMVFIFMILQAFLTRSMGETRRSGVFDNLTYGVIVIILFFYALYNITLFMFLNPSMITAIKNVVGAGSTGNSFFIFEFLFSIVFLIWILVDIRKSFKGFFFLSDDGFVMLMIATVLAQTTARIGLITQESGNSAFANYLIYDRIAIPFLIIVFLGLTIFIYYLKPQETSMFLHISNAAVEKDDKSMETILKFLKREFIRRGEKYLINDVIPQLQQLTGLPVGVVWSLVRRLNEQYMDMQFVEIMTPDGKRELYLDFIPITEKYQGDKNADKRAEKYMRDRFSNLITAKQRKKITLSKNAVSSSQSDQFVQALSVQFSRKVKDEESRKLTPADEQVILDKAIDADTKDIIYEIIKNEYIRRVNAVTEFPDFRFTISEIAPKIEEATKISPGRLYPLLKEMAVENWKLTLSAEKQGAETGEDMIIEFVAIDDFEIYDAIRKNRPEKLKTLNRIMQTWFERNIRFKRKYIERLPPEVYPDAEKEFARSYYSKWFTKTMQYFSRNFSESERLRDMGQRKSLLQQAIKLLWKNSPNFIPPTKGELAKKENPAVKPIATTNELANKDSLSIKTSLVPSVPTKKESTPAKPSPTPSVSAKKESTPAKPSPTPSVPTKKESTPAKPSPTPIAPVKKESTPAKPSPTPIAPVKKESKPVKTSPPPDESPKKKSNPIDQNKLQGFPMNNNTETSKTTLIKSKTPDNTPNKSSKKETTPKK